MDIALPLDQMTIEEKLRAMERIWENLCRDEVSVPSPAWHEDVLRARESRLQADQETCIDWDTAKKRIRESAT